MASDKSHRGNASQFYVAAELCRRGFVAVITMGNCPNTDILCSNKEGTKFVHIQVKTFRPNNRTCSVGVKAEKEYGNDFFWILCGMPEPDDTDQTFQYFIIPAKVISRNVKDNHQMWLDTPGMKGQPHNENKIRSIAIPPLINRNGWDISKYLNKWSLIENKLS